MVIRCFKSFQFGQRCDVSCCIHNCSPWQCPGFVWDRGDFSFQQLAVFWIQCGIWYEESVNNILVLVVKKSQTFQLPMSCQFAGHKKLGGSIARVTDLNQTTEYSISYNITLSTQMRVSWRVGSFYSNIEVWGFSPPGSLARNGLGLIW